jgi:flagellar biosynthesis/type III secretory pathway M-ring protein FliF/YscJ
LLIQKATPFEANKTPRIRQWQPKQRGFQVRLRTSHLLRPNLETQSTANGGNEEMRSQSSSEVKNYEVSRTVSSTMKPTNVIRKINAAVLVRERTIMDPETGLPTTQKMSEGELLQIEKLVADAVGIDKERGDSLTVSSAPFMNELSEGVKMEWFEKPYMRSIINQTWICAYPRYCYSWRCSPATEPHFDPDTSSGYAWCACF